MHFYAETFVVAWYKIVAKKLLLHIREKRKVAVRSVAGHNGDKFFVLFLTYEAYSHGGLQTEKLGQTP